MVVNKDSVTLEKKVGKGNMQLMSEGEITLPEDKPDALSVLKWDCIFVPAENRISDGRVSFDGKIKIEGMYLAKGDKSVHGFSKEMPVSDFLNIDGAAEGMYTYISSVPQSCTCRVINERKLGYKAVNDVEACVREQRECEYVEGLSDIPLNQQRFKELSLESMAVCRQDRFTVRDSISLPMGRPNIGEILSCSLRLSSVDCRAEDSSVRVSGDMNVSLLYKGQGESNPMELYEGSIPFKGELEAQGLRNDMLCDVKLSILDSTLHLLEDEDGETRIVEPEVVIGAYITGREAKTVNVLEDVYILNKDAKLTTSQEESCVWAARNTSQCPVKEVVTLEDDAPDMLQIYRADGRPFVDFVEINDGKIEIEGAVAVDILYVTGNDETPVYCCHGVVPFKHTAQAAGAEGDMECSVEAELEHIGFNMISDREVEVRCVINICAVAEDTRAVDMVTDVEICDLDREYLGSLASITIYMVRKGDTLWKLAKRFNTTVEDIAAINDIENPDLIYPGQRLIIVKRIV